MKENNIVLGAQQQLPSIQRHRSKRREWFPHLLVRAGSRLPHLKGFTLFVAETEHEAFTEANGFSLGRDDNI